MIGPPLPFFCGGSKQYKSLESRTESRTASTGFSTTRATGRRGSSAQVKARKSSDRIGFSVRVEKVICTGQSCSSACINRQISTPVRDSPGWRFYVPIAALFLQVGVLAYTVCGLNARNATDSYCRGSSKRDQSGGSGATAGVSANGTDPCQKRPRGHRSAQIGTDRCGQSVPVFPQFNTPKDALGTDGTDIYKLGSRVEIPGVFPGRTLRAALCGAHMQKASNLCPSRAQLIHEGPK